MLWALGVLALFAFEIFFPTPAEQLFSDVLAAQIGVEHPLDLGLIGNVIWTALLLFSVRYYQAAAFVERRYPYLHQLEAGLNEALGAELITREGKSYLANYPKFQRWLTFLYKVAVPCILFALPTVRIFLEVWRGTPSVSLLLDVTIYGLFAWSTYRYVTMIHADEKRR